MPMYFVCDRGDSHVVIIVRSSGTKNRATSCQRFGVTCSSRFQDRTVGTSTVLLVQSHQTTQCHCHLDMGVSVFNNFVFCVSTVEYQLNCIQTNWVIYLKYTLFIYLL